MDREQIASLRVARFEGAGVEIVSGFHLPGRIQSAIVEDLLPQKLANKIAAAFSAPPLMKEQKDLREHKFTEKNLSSFALIIEDAIFAFPDAHVIEMVAAITGTAPRQDDPNSYAMPQPAMLCASSQEGVYTPGIYESSEVSGIS
jgi:hypothetical protein